ncbi:hypothetical protein [Maribacter sp. 2308TA10-17]|uniref:hypothetical protein n=1 Tax=Maribacter sp. 2308TA10-17 TaxID=3386276 RepID=UPI0039BD564A
MNFYELKTDRRSNSEWNCFLSNEENQKYNIIESLEAGSKLQLSNGELLTMNLRNSLKDDGTRKEIPFEADLINWFDDISLNTYKTFAASVIIISSKFKEFLSKFTLPNHSYYNLRIINAENESNTTNYFMLHIHGNISDFTDFSKCEYTYTKWENDSFIKLEKGSFNSLEQFQIAEKEAFENDKTQIKISSRVLTGNFDIVWGFTNCLRVNEQVDWQLKNMELKGIKTKIFKDYHIINKSDYSI